MSALAAGCGISDSHIPTLSVSLRAIDGVADLSFIHYMRVTMAADDGSETIELGVDQAKFTLEIVGALPEHDWKGDVTAHFSGKIKYSY